MIHIRTLILAAGISAATAIIPHSVAFAADVNWTIDKSKSTVSFSGTQTGAKFDGRFSRYDATITLDPDHPEGGKISATIDMASVVTGDPQRDTALPKKEWFDIASYPQSTFKSITVKKVGENSYVADGTLTIHGVSKEVTLPFSLSVDGDTAVAKGHLDIRRDTYGVGTGPWATGQWVALDVGIDLNLIASRAK
jgi:polyisoprenoid-binding protein YceI